MLRTAQRPEWVRDHARLHRMIIDGIAVTYFAEDGTIEDGNVRLADLDHLGANDWLVIDDFSLIEPPVIERFDAVIFLNGLPVGSIPSMKKPIKKPINERRFAVVDKVGLSADECALYEVFQSGEQALLDSDLLKMIAKELCRRLSTHITVDWSRRSSARARMRILIKRLLRKYGYPPERQAAGMQHLLQRIESRYS